MKQRAVSFKIEKLYITFKSMITYIKFIKIIFSFLINTIKSLFQIIIKFPIH